MHQTKTRKWIAVHLLLWPLNYLLIAFMVESEWCGFSNASSASFNSLAYAYAYGLFFNIILFYLQVLWLVPKVFMRNRKVVYYVLSISISAAISLLETYFDYGLYAYFKIEAIDTFLDNFVITLAVNLIYGIAGFYYIFRREHKRSEREKLKLLEETYKSELRYLKAQLNPHFLFNGINSVYHLIGRNDELAKDTLMQFSKLLRYQLYESGTQITLEKELDFVAQYVQLEKTRKGSDIHMTCDIQMENSMTKIVPLLLIPFVENAFKHCSNHINSSDNRIDIKIREAGNKLYLSCVNTSDLANSKEIQTGGIGLKNVKRRLSLAYPKRHELAMNRENSLFVVDLTIDLQSTER